MVFSSFGKKLTAKSGILQLMDDLGQPLPEGLPLYQLGGGNPARVPAVELAYRKEMERILQDGDCFENVIARYDAPRGRVQFIEAIVHFLNEQYGWGLTSENIAITNGTQTAFFYLFNLFSGNFSESGTITTAQRKRILIPLMPEYIGYADQGIDDDCFVSIPSRVEYYGDNTFKYFIDFERLEEYLKKHNAKSTENIPVGAMCVSRPTNPSGNVLTDAEIRRLSALAKKYDIPLFVDNAYGLPFPSIVFTDEATPVFDENIVLTMSLSKIGLPTLRTGIVVARPEIAAAVANLNAIAALASGSLGQALAEEMIKDGRLVALAEDEVRPFYKKRSIFMQDCIHRYFAGLNYGLHRSEGALFCWLYLPDLKISSMDLYYELKKEGVITVPGEYFFFGHKEQRHGAAYPHLHYNKCLRLNYSRPPEEEEDAIKIIARVYKNFS